MEFTRSFLTGLALTLGTASFLGAAPVQQSDPCRCAYKRGTVSYPEVPPPECTPVGGVLALLVWTPATALDGHCAAPGCTQSLCSGEGSFSIFSDSSCPITVYKDLLPVTRGFRQVTYWIQDELECGGSVDYSVMQGGSEIAQFTDLCSSCSSGH